MNPIVAGQMLEMPRVGLRTGHWARVRLVTLAAESPKLSLFLASPLNPPDLIAGVVVVGPDVSIKVGRPSRGFGTSGGFGTAGGVSVVGETKS